MIDNRTPRLGLLLPDADNYLEDDVVRLSESMTILDGKVATVGADGKVPLDQLPAVAITDTFPVNSTAEMLALNAQKGDVAIVSSSAGRQSYILMAEPASTLTNWKLLNDNQTADANLREQWRRTLADAGLNLVAGSFQEGATVNTAMDVVWNITEAKCYTWGGALVKDVPAGSTPQSTGGISVGAWNDASAYGIRQELSKATQGGGTNLITHAPADYRAISLKDYLNKAPDIREWSSDSANDDTTRFQKAIAAGHNSIYVPDRAVSKDFVVGNLDITRSVKLIGDASQGIDVNGGRILKAAGADYAIHFNGQGQAGRPMGGGLYGIHVNGSNSSDLGDLVRVTSWSYFKLLNASLQNIAGWGLKLRDVMESTLDQFLFRRVGSDTKGGILLDDYIGIPTSNVNNLRIINGTWAGMGGPWVRATDSANVDLLWFMNNKFEWDFNPPVVNTTDKYILDLGQVARTFIAYNGFTHFRPDAGHNRNAGILHMGANCLATTIFEHNQAYGCNGYFWNVEGGSLHARNNFSNQADSGGNISTLVTSTKHQDIEPPKFFTSNGNINAKPAVETSLFESCHNMYGTVNNQFVPDSGAIRSTSMLVPSGIEARRFQLSPELMGLNKAIRVTARVKLLMDNQGNPIAGGQIKLNIDGATDIGTVSVAGSDWNSVRFIIQPTSLGSGNLRLSNPGTASILFDGIRVEAVDFIDWSFAWTPGAIAAGASVTSPAQTGFTGFNDPGGNLAGFSSAAFNGSSSGLICSVNSRNSGGGWEVTLYNPTAAAITPTFTRCKVRIFL